MSVLAGAIFDGSPEQPIQSKELTQIKVAVDKEGFKVKVVFIVVNPDFVI